MSEELRKKRMGDAETLLKSVASLKSVPGTERMVFLHDRIVAVIESLCAKSEGKAPFNKDQIEILKDISYQILYIVDTKSENKQSPLRRGYHEWCDYTILTKVKIISGIVATLLLSGAAASDEVRKFLGVQAIYERHFKPAAASVPSTLGTQGATAQPPRQ